MKNKPWKIWSWGSKDSINYYSLDNRDLTKAGDLEATYPLLTMKVSDRYNAEELRAYLIQIRDALNAAGIVEGTIEDPDQPK